MSENPKCVLAVCLLLLAGHQAPAAEQKIVTAAQVNGTWESKDGEFKVLALGHQQLRVEFTGTYNTGLTVNAGEAKGIAHIEGTTAVFKPDGTEGCVITMEFKGKAMEVSEGGTMDCGFGLNVSAAGPPPSRPVPGRGLHSATPLAVQGLGCARVLRCGFPCWRPRITLRYGRGWILRFGFIE